MFVLHNPVVLLFSVPASSPCCSMTWQARLMATVHAKDHFKPCKWSTYKTFPIASGVHYQSFRNSEWKGRFYWPNSQLKLPICNFHKFFKQTVHEPCSAHLPRGNSTMLVWLKCLVDVQFLSNEHRFCVHSIFSLQTDLKQAELICLFNSCLEHNVIKNLY